MNEFFAALPALLRQMPDSPEVRRAVIFAAWRRAAGRQLSERTKPISIEDGRLFVAVADRNWKRQLGSLADELLYKVNASLRSSEVKFIEFVIDPSVVPARTELDPGDISGKGLPDIDPGIAAAAARIRDTELRKQFLYAAANTLARKERNGR